MDGEPMKRRKKRVEYTQKELRNITVEQNKKFTSNEVLKITPNGYLFFQMRTALMKEMNKQNKVLFLTA